VHRFFGLVMAAALSITALPAIAGGMQPAAAPAVPPAIAAPANDWTGGYVGGSLAFISSSALYCDDGAAYAQCDDPFDGLPEPSPEGGMIGITAGYDWQNGNIVYGVAGDLLFGDLSGSAGSSGAPTGFGCVATCDLDISTIAMLRGRVGYAMGDILPFVTAGVAVTQATASVVGVGSNDGNFTSVVLGVGGDYMLSDTLTAGFDVLHLFGGDDNFFDPGSPCGFCGVGDFSATIARVNVTYRF